MTGLKRLRSESSDATVLRGIEEFGLRVNAERRDITGETSSPDFVPRRQAGGDAVPEWREVFVRKPQREGDVGGI